MESLKIVIIGAGSREFSRGLIHDLYLEKELLESRAVTLGLCDINRESLDVMTGYAERVNRLFGSPVQILSSTDRTELLAGADFVLIAVEQNRMDLWEQDFRIPQSFGFKQVYGENGGPGSLFHTLRNYNIYFPILEDIKKLCPDTWLLNFTNPEARILTAILRHTEIKALGLCHGFYDFYHFIGKVFDRPYEEFDIRTAGMNHFFTFYKIEEKSTGKDMIPLLKEKLRENPDLLPPLARYMWEKFDVIGIDSDHHIGEYIPYAHEFAGLHWEFGIEKRKVLKDSRFVDSNVTFQAWRYNVDVRTYLDGPYGKKIQDQLENRVDVTLDDIQSSGELAVPVIADMILDRKNWRPAVNVLNTEGYIENLDRDACIEVPAMVDKTGVHPETVGPLDEAFAAQIRLQNSIQKITAEAWNKRSRKLLLQALLLDPVVDSAVQAEKMLDYMLEIQEDYLPRFS